MWNKPSAFIEHNYITIYHNYGQDNLKTKKNPKQFKSGTSFVERLDRKSKHAAFNGTVHRKRMAVCLNC